MISPWRQRFVAEIYKKLPTFGIGILSGSLSVVD